MKKILLIAMVMLGVVFTSNAQNANRSGVFVEITPGVTIITDCYDFECGPSFSTSFDAGYRWAISTHCALDAKLTACLPIEGIDDGHIGVTILPSFRYTSLELGNSNKSVYFSVGLGFCFPMQVGYDVQLGFNLSNHFYLGLKHNGFVDIEWCFCAPIGICCGYRF